MNAYTETRDILKKYNIVASKKLGQNFLIDDEVIDGIISASEVSSSDLVIEIGPGLGTLTSRLLENAGKVIAIELDKRMVEILNDRFKFYDNFELIHEDVLKVDLNKLIEENKVGEICNAKIVANLPYYITTPIIMKLLEDKLDIESITVMIQKEVADRLVTNPGTLQLSTTKGDGNPERVLSLSEIEATDNSSAALTLTKIDSTVQLNLAGTYTQTYKLADAAGNYITFNVSYRVYDRVSEVSYLENGQMVLLQNGDTFTHNVKLYFDGTATLDGEAVSSGILVGEGEHTIIVTNDDGISLTINFTITIPRPEIIVKASPNGDPIELQPYNFYNEPIYLEFRNATKVIIVYYTTENVEQRVEITDPDLIAAGYVLTNANGTGNFTQYSINAIANDEENIIASIIVI